MSALPLPSLRPCPCPGWRAHLQRFTASHSQSWTPASQKMATRLASRASRSTGRARSPSVLSRLSPAASPLCVLAGFGSLLHVHLHNAGPAGDGAESVHPGRPSTFSSTLAAPVPSLAVCHRGGRSEGEVAAQAQEALLHGRSEVEKATVELPVCAQASPDGLLLPHWPACLCSY